MVMTTDTPIKIQIVKSLSNLKPSRMIAVKADNESSFSLYVTDKVGVPYPLKDLQGSGGITGLTNTDGNLVITGVNNKVINIAPALLSLINSALQSGANISELVNDEGFITISDVPTNVSEFTNDAGYLTTFTETDPIFQASEASLFVAGDKSKLDGIEAGAEVNNISDVNATDLTDGGETNLHIHDSRYYTEVETDIFLQKKQNLPTGFITGLQLSINADPTKIDIAPGAYAVSDFTDLENITVQIIQIINPITGITPSYLNTGNISYIALDINQNVVQSSSPFTNEQRRTLAILGAAIHSNLVNVNVVNEIKAPIVAPTNQLHDLIRAIGSFNLEGNIYSANGVNLQLNKSAGIVFGLGINANSYLNPHELSIPTQTGLTFRYRLRNSFEYANTETIDPANYDNAGVLTPLLNNNKWQVQRINLFQSGLTRIQPGQHQYDSLLEAEAAIKTENFVTEANIAQNAIFRSYLIIKKNATNLSDITQAKFIPVDKFGNVITGNTALTAANIISALGYTPANGADYLLSDISTYSPATTPLSPTDKLIVFQSGVKKEVAVSEVNKYYVSVISTPSPYVTGTLSETQLVKIPIDPLTFSAVDVLRIINIMISKLGTNNAATVRLKISTSATMPAGVTGQIAQFTVGNTSLIQNTNRTFYIDSGNLKGWTFTTAANTDVGSLLTAMSTVAFDRTQTQYLYISGTLLNTADSLRIEGTHVTNR